MLVAVKKLIFTVLIIASGSGFLKFITEALAFQEIVLEVLDCV
jgi:hypothetical protein